MIDSPKQIVVVFAPFTNKSKVGKLFIAKETSSEDTQPLASVPTTLKEVSPKDGVNVPLEPVITDGVQV